MRNKAKSFFNGSNNVVVEKSCSVFQYLSTASDCAEKKDTFVSLSYEVSRGELSIQTTVSKPDIQNGINYKIGINNELVHESSGTVNISEVISGYERINGEGKKFPLDIVIHVFNDDKTAGCTYEYRIESIEKEKISFTETSENTYSFAYEPDNDMLTLDIASLSFVWSIGNDVITQFSTPSETMSDSVMFLYTDKPDDIVSLSVPEIGLSFKTDRIVIPRNRYGIKAKLQSVINGRKLYTNIIDVEAENIEGLIDYDIIKFIDNHPYLPDYFDSEQYLGSKVQVVLVSMTSVFLANRDRDFDRTLTLEYLSFVELDAVDTMESFLGSYFINQLIDSTDGVEIKSTYNDKRSINILFEDTDNYALIDGEPSEITHKAVSEGDFIVEIMDEEIIDREGRIYTEYGQMNVINYDIAPEEVSMVNLINKKQLMVDEMITSLLYQEEDVRAYFNVASTGLVDSQFGLMAESSNGPEIVLIKDLMLSNSNLVQIEFYTSFIENGASAGSKALIRTHSTNGNVISTYGFEKLQNGNYLKYNVTSTPTEHLQGSLSEQYVIELTTQMDIGYISLVVSDGVLDSLAIKSLVLTERN